eukprot:COSAG01_NODE_1934_length_8866_cov_17.762633_2_plen_116_part_00
MHNNVLYNVPLTPTVLLCGGATAGALAQTVVYPLDLLRRQQQVAGMSAAARSNVVADSTCLALQRIVHDGGYRSLFSGILPTYLKVMPATAIGMTVTSSIVMAYRKPAMSDKASS